MKKLRKFQHWANLLIKKRVVGKVVFSPLLLIVEVLDKKVQTTKFAINTKHFIQKVCWEFNEL